MNCFENFTERVFSANEVYTYIDLRKLSFEILVQIKKCYSLIFSPPLITKPSTGA